MRIKNINQFTAADLQKEGKKGGRFVHYTYTISLLVVTFKRTSGVYLIRGNENPAAKGIRYTLLSLFLGWWSIPFGPQYCFQSIRTNLRGGKDVTDEVMATVDGYLLFQEVQKEKTFHRLYQS